MMHMMSPLQQKCLHLFLDYEKFTEEVVDKKDLKVFARFEQVMDLSK